MLLNIQSGTWDTDAWDDIDTKSEYAAGHAWNRCYLLFQSDPFINMMNGEFASAVLRCVFSQHGLGDSTLHCLECRKDVEFYLNITFKEMPLVTMLTPQFLDRMKNYIALAIFPQDNNRLDKE